jgi:hypothetical protein
MFEQAPNGHFLQDLIVFSGLRKGGYVAKGFIFEPPDLMNAAPAHLNEFQDQLSLLLASLHEHQRLQVQWFCDSDYRAELLRYREETERASNLWTRRSRNERFTRYWQAMLDRKLRRQRLVLYISRSIDVEPKALQSVQVRREYYELLLGQLNAEFKQIHEMLLGIFPHSRIVPMKDADHYRHYARFLNPSFAERFDYDPLEAFEPNLSIHENCWHGEAVGVTDAGFILDGYHHGLLVLSRWPKVSFPGIIHRLTNLSLLDYTVTVNVEPLSTRAEIAREEKAHDRLAGDYASEKKLSLVTSMEKKQRKIAALMQGHTLPFNVQFIVRAWDRTRDGLAAKLGAIKNAIHSMNSAQYFECVLPTTSKHVFFQTWPGWTWSRYGHRNLYGENRYVADLLPISATFTGHLATAEAIYDGPMRNLVGVKTFSGSDQDATPQHAVLLGMSGAGKSVTVCDLLSQTEGYFDYTVIIEEGLSYGIYTQTVEPDAQPIIIQPDGNLTINYLDTHQLPLTPDHLSTATALVARMIGVSTDEDRQMHRQAQIAKYLNLLYDDVFTDWSRRNEGALTSVARHACALARFRRERMQGGATSLEVFVDFRDWQNTHADEAGAYLAATQEPEVLRFLKEPATSREVRNLAFASLAASEYPTHRMLQELMQLEGSDEQIRELADRLLPWCAEGNYGALFDGTSNVSLTGKIAHFELGYIPDSAKALRAAAGFLITNYTRQHIITLPRAVRKRNIYEEVARLMDIPGGEEIVKESYAQLRKFNCWNIAIVQQYARFKESRIRAAVFGNSRQFFLMRQNDRADLEDIGQDIDLSEPTKQQILSYPLPDQQPADKFAAFTYLHTDAVRAICGTVHNVASPEMLYCSSTTGAHFERRSKELRGCADPVEAIVRSVSSEPLPGVSAT